MLGSVAIVGGSSGIGLAVAAAALAAGAEVSLVSRSTERLQSAAVKLGKPVRTVPADARAPEALRRCFAEIGRIDHLVTTTTVSAARMGVTRSMADMPADGALAFFEGKFWTQYRAAQAALPHLSETGSITFTSGIASRKGLPGHTIVGAVNAAIEAAARQLAREIGPRRVNAVAPGLTDTGAYDHLPPQERERFFAHVTGQIPVRRPARPEEIAEAYLFAMRATYLTGAVLDIDGGLLVH
jgi:NAD(P)-dependent dehydrogenase (short-subunit alcohol dehydrogenase family)